MILEFCILRPTSHGEFGFKTLNLADYNASDLLSYLNANTMLYQLTFTEVLGLEVAWLVRQQEEMTVSEMVGGEITEVVLPEEIHRHVVLIVGLNGSLNAAPCNSIQMYLGVTIEVRIYYR